MTEREKCICICRARGCTTAGILGCMMHFTASLWIERAGTRLEQCSRPNFHADQVTDEYLDAHAAEVEGVWMYKDEAEQTIRNVEKYGRAVIAKALQLKYPQRFKQVNNDNNTRTAKEGER